MNNFIKIEVSSVSSESLKSWLFLVKKGKEPGTWSNGCWFPKSLCIYYPESNILELPEWLLIKLNIEKIVNYVD